MSFSKGSSSKLSAADSATIESFVPFVPENEKRWTSLRLAMTPLMQQGVAMAWPDAVVASAVAMALGTSTTDSGIRPAACGGVQNQGSL
jgi:hypothetical protein